MDNLTKYNERMKGPGKVRIFTSIGLALLIILSFFSGYFTHYAIKGKNVQVISEVVEIMDKVGFVYDPVLDKYVKLEGDKVAQLIAGNFLDGYSAYYTKEEYEKILQENTGKYVGIGVSFSATELANSNQIVKVSVNSPAYNAGIKDGDKIQKVRLSVEEGKPENQYTLIANGKQLSDFMQMVEKDQALDLVVDRAGDELTFFSVHKTTYYMSYVTYRDSEQFAYFSPRQNQSASDMQSAYESIKVNDDEAGDSSFGDDVALVTLSAFEGDAGHQIGAILKYMVERGRTSLILDLCGNGGGDMKVLTEVASYLIYNKGEDNYKIVSANEKLDGDGVETEEAYRVSNFSVEKNKFNTGVKRITVMADKNTASASECLIGAMIHYAKSEDVEQSEQIFSHDNLVIVGHIADEEMVYRTYGKGIMQTTYRLQSGGALKLTTAKITWPDEKTCIHKVGIKPTSEENKADSSADALLRALEIASLSVQAD